MKVFDFEHVQLLPKRCIVESRSECDASVKLGKHTFKIPIVPANMVTILNEDISIEMAKKGYFYVMHRFDIDTKGFIKRAKSEGVIASISVGVKDE